MDVARSFRHNDWRSLVSHGRGKELSSQRLALPCVSWTYTRGLHLFEQIPRVKAKVNTFQDLLLSSPSLEMQVYLINMRLASHNFCEVYMLGIGLKSTNVFRYIHNIIYFYIHLKIPVMFAFYLRSKFTSTLLKTKDCASFPVSFSLLFAEKSIFVLK